jgi:hypothetical protein
LKLTVGHLVVIGAIVALGVVNVVLLTRPDSVPEPVRTTSIPELPVVEPIAASTPAEPASESAKHANWPPEFVGPALRPLVSREPESEFDLPKRVRPSLEGLFEQKKEVRELPVSIRIPRLRASSGVEPMPFGGSMFGPWDTGTSPNKP